MLSISRSSSSFYSSSSSASFSFSFSLFPFSDVITELDTAVPWVRHAQYAEQE